MAGWKQYLTDATLNVLPCDYVQSTDGKIIESAFHVEFPAVTLDTLRQLSQRYDASVYQIGLALYMLLIHRICGDEDVVVGSCLAGSDRGALHSVARYASFSGGTKLEELLLAVKCSEETATADPALHTDIRAMFGGKDLFRTLFLEGAPEQLTHIPFKDLTLVMDISKSASKVHGFFNSLLFKKQRILYLIEQWFAIIHGANNSDLPLSSISLITNSQVRDQVIPDPTANLELSNFRGTIQGIFAANAARFPNRECVIETANIYVEGSHSRSFTYRQIDEASNTIAHYLVSSGIVVDDVVMIYAYRGVDLVVAVMGVLKAGATFSVIDPAYPAARQNVYLSVAKPRGLLVLAKAGKLSPTVREYIQENLKLKAELHDIELQDSGAVSALQSLEEAWIKRSVPASVDVGPDNHPTLSFTSGSEGVPKGVRGRHFSLTYYFPWMAETFGLSDNDKFTMLSGIAHDPIQRDIFTPLFLGAKLYVPTSDDIGTPGRLAEWMAKTGCTVTHLTPAMGQLLSAQATAKIEGLKNAFFVGDILTKRDCFKLQSLAQNVAIINMYGTTETQRAVSYFRIPSVSEDPHFLTSQKDVIPAGKGMLNVQMLVVNRNASQKICGVGEIGEIYVRAGGLSDGYLDLPELTAKKFLTSWFVPSNHWNDHLVGQKGWLGPRDRLYRTGDLGRYLPDGNTEVSGRADDQVKIRGFRIELGEINTHLSKHPNVRENITLVRRNKDEEPILVAYIVPEQSGNDDMLSAHESLDEDEEAGPMVKGLVQYQRLIREIKSYLKTKLPSYAVPSVIVPLPKLPLNPNGKIDKPRLPFPDTVQMQIVAKHLRNKRQNTGEDPSSQFSEVENQVWQLWSSILPNHPPQVEPTDSFFDLGGHSILATKMIFEARTKLGVPDLALGTIFSSPSIREFARKVEELKCGDHILEDNDLLKKRPDLLNSTKDLYYGDDADYLVTQLPEYLTRTKPLEDKSTVFLTGVTGFLGSFILRDLMNRSEIAKVIVQVRAKDNEHALDRVKATAKAYGLWKHEYIDRLDVVTGSLETPKLGLTNEQWSKLVNDVDVVIHNGALVHWVYPYSTLRGPNVMGTLNVMSMCTVGKPKYFTFVSSTSVIDTQHYLDLSDKLIESGKAGIPEDDFLEGSRVGLGTGYGQSKWVSERLLRVAGASKGLRGAIVRPGYIVGDSKTGVCNTDDFLLRMLKGSQELGLFPAIINSVNMVPVDHVARATVAAALNGSIFDKVSVLHITSHPRITFDKFLGSLNEFGYSIKEADYLHWRVTLEKYVLDNGNSALFPLLHFVLDNLPQDTKAPELDDSNTRRVLKADVYRTGQDISEGAGVDLETLRIYVSFLVAIGFLEQPSDTSKLGSTKASNDIIANFSQAGGRSR